MQSIRELFRMLTWMRAIWENLICFNKILLSNRQLKSKNKRLEKENKNLEKIL